MNRRRLIGSSLVLSLASVRVPTALAQTASPEASPAGQIQALFGNAFGMLVPGTEGNLGVVQVGKIANRSVPFVLYNGTNDVVCATNVTGAARASGKLVGNVIEPVIVPYQIAPGGFAIGCAFVGDVPEEAEVIINVDQEPPGDRIVDLSIIEIEPSQDETFGMVKNPSSDQLGVVWIIGLFFADDGTVTGYINDYADSDRIDAGESSPFGGYFYGSEQTANYLFGASGYIESSAGEPGYEGHASDNQDRHRRAPARLGR